MSRLATTLRLREEAPRGRPALWSALLWIAIAVGAMAGAMLVAVNGSSSVVLRIVGGVALVLVSTVALMLASDSIERFLDGCLSAWGGRLQWLTTSVVALSVMVAFGAAISSFAPNAPGVSSLAVDFWIDLFLGLIGGLVAIGLILGVSWVFGVLILCVHRRLGLEARGEDRWGPPARRRGSGFASFSVGSRWAPPGFS